MKVDKLFNRHFFLLFQGQLISQVGSSIWLIALVFWLKHATESATIVGLMAMTASLPGVILGPLGGTIADYYSRKKIIVISDLINGCLMLVVAIVMYFMSEKVNLIIGLLFFTTLVSSIIGAAFRPAVTASIPDLIPRGKIEAANSLLSASRQLSLLLGQVLGGLLFRVLGAPVLILINAASYLLSSLSEMFISIPQRTASKTKGWAKTIALLKSDTITGFKYVRNKRGLLDLFLVAAVLNFILGPVIVLMPFFVEDTLHASPEWFGFLMAGYAVGAMIGYVVIAAINISSPRRSGVLITLLFFHSIGLAFYSFSTSVVAALSLFIFMGACLGVVNIIINSTLQLTTPSKIRGRVSGLMSTLSGGLMPIAMALAGVVADLLDQDIRLIYLLCAIFSSLVSLLLVFSKEFHAMLSYGEEVTQTPLEMN